jgi:hypothetical protein
LRINDRQVVFQYFEPIIGFKYSEDFRGALWLDEYNEVDGGVAYNHFQGKTCQMHVVIQKPEKVTREIIRQVFEFPFVVCDLEWILGPVAATNEKALNFDLKLGFREIARLPNGASNGSDLIILGMQKQDCRWLKRK